MLIGDKEWVLAESGALLQSLVGRDASDMKGQWIFAGALFRKRVVFVAPARSVMVAFTSVVA